PSTRVVHRDCSREGRAEEREGFFFDIRCRQRGLPRVETSVLEHQAVPGTGVQVREMQHVVLRGGLHLPREVLWMPDSVECPPARDHERHGGRQVLGRRVSLSQVLQQRVLRENRRSEHGRDEQDGDEVSIQLGFQAQCDRRELHKLLLETRKGRTRKRSLPSFASDDARESTTTTT
ncbi:hypothetical protein LINPERPRIM_LOCUS3692, partial [Linum perenne]